MATSVVPPAIVAALLDPRLDPIWDRLLQPVPEEAAEANQAGPDDPDGGAPPPARGLVAGTTGPSREPHTDAA